MGSRFDDFERELLATADEHLPVLAVARSATEALMTALEGAAVRSADEHAPPSYYIRSAILLLAAIALRIEWQ